MLMINLSVLVWIFYGSIVTIMSIQLVSIMKSCFVTKQYKSEECTIALQRCLCSNKTSASDGNHQVSSLASELWYGWKLWVTNILWL